MIKRFSFVERAADVDPEVFAPAWIEAAAAAQAPAEPADARPVRVAVCIPVAGLTEVAGPPPHDAVTIEWFPDIDALGRHQRWLDSTSPGGEAHELGLQLDRPVAWPPSGRGSGGGVVVADEVVLRGADWLARRWTDGHPELKHMALAHRAPGLTPEAFSQRWRDHAGQVGGGAAAGGGGSGATTTIPEDVKGLAYVQNHPRLDLRPSSPQDEGSAYDAVNEVYLADLEGLERRVRWFRDNQVGARPDGLTGASWFLAVSETIVFASP